MAKRFASLLLALCTGLGIALTPLAALAGTTGTLGGDVVDATTGAPIAAAVITATSPSQSASTTTDGRGHFTFVSLAPDTYTVAAQLKGYDPTSLAGVSVFADQGMTVSIELRKTLKEIAKVSARAVGSLVKPGTTADIYSVNAPTQAAAVALGGGGGLNNAFSAIASVPGVFVPQGQTGAYQSVFIRGGNYTQLGYEYDGVPIQRAFDQYPGGNLSSLGQQELQVYTGAPPVNTGSTALAGFINQVIKTGTYPGFADAKFGFGSPVFYHQMSLETGGANPDRTFSYYAGFSGYDQDFAFQTGAGFDNTWGGLVNVLRANCSTPNPTAGCYAASLGGPKAGPTGFLLGPTFWGATTHIADRDTVLNFHFAVPHKRDGGRDDLQLLYNNTYLRTMFASSLNDFGMHTSDIVNGTYTMSNGTAIPACATATSQNCTVYGGTPLTFADKLVYGGQTGVALTGASLSTVPYYFPGSSTARSLDSLIPATERDSYQQNATIFKLQYQRNINSNSYMRLFGYTAYSDWLQYGPGGLNPNFYGSISQDYKLGAHTRGLELNYVNQINDKHLLNFTASYTTASTFRTNASVLQSSSTTSASSGSDSTTVAFLVDSTNPTNGQCYSASAGAVATPTSCGLSGSSRYVIPFVGTAASAQCPSGQAALCLAHSTDPTIATAGTKTCGAGPCEYYVVNDGTSAVFNTVVPKFAAFALQDSWHPTDKLLVTLGLRYDDFKYGLADTTGNGARTFWVNWYNRYNCLDPNQAFAVVSNPAPGTSCSAAGLKDVNFTSKSAAFNDYPELQPRVGLSYTYNQNNVFRLSWGKYAQPASSAFQQYNTSQPNIVAFDSTFFSNGYLAPSHTVYPEISFNLDGGWEHQVKGSDISWSISPYLRKTSNELITVVLDPKTNFVSGINVGRKTVKGVEFALQKGDITRNGLFAKLAYTYTHGTVMYTGLPNGTTVVDSLNNGIKNYNGFTQFCANNPNDSRCPSAATVAANAAPCFSATNGNPVPCGPGTVANPYWLAKPGNLYNAGDQYPIYSQLAASTVFSGSTGSYIVPHVLALILNYKHDKWNVTPTLQWQGGSVYGKPTDIGGVNPKTCRANAGLGVNATLGGTTTNDPRYPYGSAGGDPYNAAACSGSIVIPDPYTGNFDAFGAFRQPNKWSASLKVAYDVSPRITVSALAVNLLTGCNGGSKVPWAVGGRAGCVYTGSVYPGNFYNPGDTIDQGYRYPYRPVFGNVFQSSSGGQANPLQLYVEAKVKL